MGKGLIIYFTGIFLFLSGKVLAQDTTVYKIDPNEDGWTTVANLKKSISKDSTISVVIVIDGVVVDETSSIKLRASDIQSIDILNDVQNANLHIPPGRKVVLIRTKESESKKKQK
jgi:hypothetical protein